jgi:hypothetical protein
MRSQSAIHHKHLTKQQTEFYMNKVGKISTYMQINKEKNQCEIACKFIMVIKNNFLQKMKNKTEKHAAHK